MPNECEENVNLENCKFPFHRKGTLTQTCFLKHAYVWYHFLENFKRINLGLLMFLIKMHTFWENSKKMYLRAFEPPARFPVNFAGGLWGRSFQGTPIHSHTTYFRRKTFASDFFFFHSLISWVIPLVLGMDFYLLQAYLRLYRGST